MWADGDVWSMSKYVAMGAALLSSMPMLVSPRLAKDPAASASVSETAGSNDIFGEISDEDAVWFNANGTLMKASRRALLVTPGTYFYGLLNSGQWSTDDSGILQYDPFLLRILS
jgi:hypothetical protein